MREQAQKKDKEERLSAVFIHLAKFSRDEGGKKKRGWREILKEKKGYLYNVCIFDHLSLNFVAFVTPLM